jgi:hypothetical protein
MGEEGVGNRERESHAKTRRRKERERGEKREKEEKKREGEEKGVAASCRPMPSAVPSNPAPGPFVAVE